jgi:hypothetical protein
MEVIINMKKDTNKSLIDNPLESIGNLVGINSVTGRRFSQEAIEENNAEIQEEEAKTFTMDEVQKYIKKDITKQKPLTDKESKTLGSVINRIKKEAKQKEEEETKEEAIEEKITSYEETFKETEEASTSLNANSEEDKSLYVKKTYIIKQDYIDLIEGLALYTGKERKEVVEELLKKATDLIDPTIKEKALKELKKSKKDIDTKEIF